MDPTRTKLAEQLFLEAVELPPPQRPAFLDDRCRGDDVLRSEVESLLRHESQLDERFLQDNIHSADQADVAQTAELSDPRMVPLRIGRYRVVRLIGEGGMGTVYEAEQEQPRRRVALKVMRPGLVGTALSKRFQHEAQILGQLQHPGIAQVYEAGVAPIEWPGDHPAAAQGARMAPFFAMELIRGQALDVFCDQRAFDLRRRLELFAAVCDAVAFAHASGVIHRDIKPANILVDELFQPKILDFGIARATDVDVKITMQTGAGELIGTLAYMSPEQVSGNRDDLDVRSDVYALGVVLYELVSGRLPYEISGTPIPEAVRIIREEAQTRLGSIDSRLRGDVETIAEKALEKDRDRRYSSAAHLADDVRRYLSDQPIAARPASAWYQLRTFARRNRRLVTWIALFHVTLVAGLVTTLALALRERTLRRQVIQNEQALSVSEEQARRLAYRSSIAAACAALERHDVRTARSYLEEAPVGLRGWEWRHVFSRLDDSVLSVSLGKPWSLISDICFSLDGSTLDLWTGTEQVRRWNTRSGKSIETDPPDGRRRGVSRRGTASFNMTPDGAMKIRHRPSGTTFGHQATIPASGIDDMIPRVTDDGCTLLYHSERNRADDAMRFHYVDLPTGRVTDLADLPFSLYSVGVLSPAGVVAFFSRESDGVHLWDPASGQTTRMTALGGKVYDLRFSPDGRRFALAQEDHTVRLFDVESARELAAGRGHVEAPSCVEFSSDGAIIASAGRDRAIRLWNADDMTIRAIFDGHEGSVVGLRFAPDDRQLASVGIDGTLHLWDTSRRGDSQMLIGHELYVYPVAFAPDGRFLVSASWDGTLRLWDTQTGQPLRVLECNLGPPLSLTVSPDNQHIVAFGRDRDGRTPLYFHWDLAQPENVPTPLRLPAGEYHWPVGFLAGAPNAPRLLLKIDPLRLTALVWDLKDGETMEVPVTPNMLERVTTARLSPDRDLYIDAVGTTMGDAINVPAIYDLTTGVELWKPPLHFQLAYAFEPPEPTARCRFASIKENDGSTLCIWDGRTGEALAELRGHSDEILAVAWSPDGSRIVTAGRDCIIRFWDTETYEQVAQLRAHQSYIWSLAFSPDGSTLASGSGDATIRLWHTTSLADRLRTTRAGPVLQSVLNPE